MVSSKQRGLSALVSTLSRQLRHSEHLLGSSAYLRESLSSPLVYTCLEREAPRVSDQFQRLPELKELRFPRG